MATNVLETLDSISEAETAAAWTSLREILKRADKPRKDDHLQLAKAMDTVGVTRDDLPVLISILAEFDGLADADAKAKAAAERVVKTRAMQEQAIADHTALIESTRLAIRKQEQHIRAINEGLADAERSAAAALERQARRHALLTERADLLGTANEAAALAAETAAAQEQERQQQREIVANDAIESAKMGRLMDALTGELRRRVVDEAARKGTVSRHTVDPNFEGDAGEIPVSYGGASAVIEQEIKNARENILAQLVAGDITQAQAGKAVVSLGIYLGKLNGNGSKADRAPALAIRYGQ